MAAFALSSLLAGCGKMENSGRNGVYVNGRMESELKSGFTGVLLDSNLHTICLYANEYDRSPIPFSGNATVSVYGELIVKIKDEEILITKDCITSINVTIPSAELSIPMNHGVYEGTVDGIASVEVADYSIGNVLNEQQMSKNVNSIDINIIFTDNRRIHITYKGVMPFNGYY
ncbi:MAG: hypothetical protein Q4F39_00235 [Bacteroidia bacterium]|nr:hypothetical protein [Bacteroidia bacterium]